MTDDDPRYALDCPCPCDCHCQCDDGDAWDESWAPMPIVTVPDVSTWEVP